MLNLKKYVYCYYDRYVILRQIYEEQVIRAYCSMTNKIIKTQTVLTLSRLYYTEYAYCCRQSISTPSTKTMAMATSTTIATPMMVATVSVGMSSSSNAVIDTPGSSVDPRYTVKHKQSNKYSKTSCQSLDLL